MATEESASGCVTGHVAYIYDRGGQRRVAQLKSLSQVKWGRRRDEYSEASIIVQGEACSEQAPQLAAIEPKRSELVIFRGPERVWEGPVWRMTYESDSVEVYARDISMYLMGTAMSKEYSNQYPNTTEVTTRIDGIIRAELARWESLDPPVNILPYLTTHHFDNEARTSMKTKAYEMTVGEHLDNMSQRQGIDYTTVGRALHIWDTSRNLGKLRTLTEADFFGDVIVSAYGADHTETAYVVTEDGAVGKAGSPSGYYGPWEKIFTVYNEEDTDAPTQAELNSQAQRNLTGRTPVPVEVRVPDNSSIRLSDTLSINDLVCGVQIPLRATLNARQLQQLQKLDQVTVTETADGESVQVTMSPATKPDSDDTEG